MADVGAKGGQYGYGLILEIALKSIKYDEFGKSFMAMIFPINVGKCARGFAFC